MKERTKVTLLLLIFVSACITLAVISASGDGNRPTNLPSIDAMQPISSNGNVQQPEDGLWAEYTYLEVQNGSISNTAWWYVNTVWINATHYNTTILQLYNNTNDTTICWFVVNNQTNIIEDELSIWGSLLGENMSLFAPNESQVDTKLYNRSILGPARNYTVTGSFNIQGFGMAIECWDTLGESAIQYLNDSGLLAYSWSNGSVSGEETYTELILTRTNLFDLAYQPPSLGRKAWIRVDGSILNKTDNCWSPLSTMDLEFTPINPNGSSNVLNATFNVTSDTVVRLANADERSPQPYNDTGILGLDMLMYDTTFLEVGQLIALPTSYLIMPGGNITVIVLGATGTEQFKNRTCWKLVTPSYMDLNATFWIDNSTGIILRAEYYNQNETIIFDVVYGIWFNASFSIPQPTDGGWLDLGGYELEHANGSDFQAPMNVKVKFRKLDDKYYNVSQVFMDWIIEENGSDGSITNVTLSMQTYSMIVENRTLNSYNATMDNMSLTGFFGKTMSIPTNIENGTIIHLTFGPNPWLPFVVQDVNDFVLGQPAIRCTTQYHETGGNNDTRVGTMWFSAFDGLPLKVEDGKMAQPPELVLYRTQDNLTTPFDQIVAPLGGVAQYSIIEADLNESDYHTEDLFVEVTDLTTDTVNFSISMASIDYDEHFDMNSTVLNVSSRMGTAEWKVDRSTRTILESPDNAMGAGQLNYFGHEFFIIPSIANTSIGDWIISNLGPDLDRLFEVVAFNVSFAGYDCVQLNLISNLSQIHSYYDGGLNKIVYEVGKEPLNMSVYIDSSTGLFVGLESMSVNKSFRIVIGIETITNPINSRPQPVDGMFAEYWGYLLNETLRLDENTTINDTVAFYSKIAIKSVNSTHYDMDSIILQSITNMSISKSDYPNFTAIRGFRYRSTVENKTNRIMWMDNDSVLTSESYGYDNVTYNLGGFYGHPMGILTWPLRTGEIMLMNFGPQIDVPFEVVNITTYNGIPSWELRGALPWMSAATIIYSQLNGLMLMMDVPGFIHLELLRTNLLDDGSGLNASVFNTQPPDGSFAHIIGFSIHNKTFDNNSKIFYEPISQTWTVAKVDDILFNVTVVMWELNDTDYGNGTTIVEYNKRTFQFTVENESRLIVGGEPFMSEFLIDSPIFGFNPMKIFLDGVGIGSIIPISAGPMPFMFGEVVGLENITGILCWKIQPYSVLYTFEGMVDLYFDASTGYLVQENMSSPDESFFIRISRENITNPLPQEPIQDGEWFEYNGIRYDDSFFDINEGPRFEMMPSLEFIMFLNGAGNTFNVSADGTIFNSTRMPYDEVVDEDTFLILNSTSLVYDPNSTIMTGMSFNGYFGHSTFRIPVYGTEIGTFYLINLGPELDLPFVVTGEGYHHGKEIWILTPHPDFEYWFGSGIANMTRNIEIWYYKANGLFAFLKDDSYFDFGDGFYYNVTSQYNTLYDSTDIDPVNIPDGLWFDFIMAGYQNGTEFGKNFGGFEFFQTGPTEYTSRFINAGGMGMYGPMLMSWSLDINNVTRFVSNFTMAVEYGPPDLGNMSEIILTDLFNAPVTLDIGDVYLIFQPGDPKPLVLNVTAIQLVDTIFGTRNAIICTHANDYDNFSENATFIYDASEGFLLQLEFINEDKTAGQIMKQILNLTLSNFGNSTRRIDLPVGYSSSFSGFYMVKEYQYSPYGFTSSHYSDFSINSYVTSNNGFETFVNVTIDAFDWYGWVLASSMNNRYLWIDQMDPVAQSMIYPNETGAVFTINSFVIYTDLSVGDIVSVIGGAGASPILQVKNLSTTYRGIPAIYLEGDGGSTQAWYNATDGTLLMMRIYNRTIADPFGGYKRIETYFMINDYFAREIYASFTYSPASPQNQENILFMDTSTGPVDKWLWLFCDDTTQTVQNPVHSFYSAGDYEVCLIAENTATGELSYFDQTVFVTGNYAPYADFYFSSYPKEGSFVEFWDMSYDPDGNITSWEWWVDGALVSTDSSMNYTFFGTGNYNVTLIVVDDGGLIAQRTEIFNVQPNQPPTCMFIPDKYNASVNEFINFDGNLCYDPDGWVDIWYWDFGDGTNSSDYYWTGHSYASPGSYLVTLTIWDDSGANATWSEWIYVINNTAPFADFNWTPAIPMLTDIVQFNDLSYDMDGFITGWEWDFDMDGMPDSNQPNPTFMFPKGGWWDVRLRVWDNDGAVGECILSIRILEPPNISLIINPPDPKVGENVFFDASATYDPDGWITNWYWDFGDGWNSTDFWSTHHTYTAPGNYTLNLTVTDDTFLNSSYIIVLEVLFNNPPVANFTYNPSNPQEFEVIAFNDRSFDPDGVIIYWTWDFGDGTLLQFDEFNITFPVWYSFAAPGNYNVSLIVIDDLGLIGEYWQIITVTSNQPPIANFTYSPASPNSGENVIFTDLSTDPDGFIAAWSWDFGDGSPIDTIQNPFHVYNFGGMFTVNLTVWDNAGLSDSITMSIIINESPVANYTYTPVSPKTNETVSFFDSSYDVDGVIVSWVWDFGDGSPTSNLKNPTHVFTAQGNYNVSLTVTDNDGGFDVFSIIIPVHDNYPPIANFTWSPIIGKSDQPVAFTDTSFDQDGTIVAWNWDFGDNSSSTLQNPSHVYSAPSDYTVNLMVTDNDGAVNNISYIVQVVDNYAPQPEFSWAPPMPKIGEQVNFTDLSVDWDGTITAWQWVFGDGSPISTVQNPVHAYAAGGNYTVTLIVTDNSSASNSTSHVVQVYANQAPNASFTYIVSQPRVGESWTFVDQSTDNDGTIIAWFWDFGDNSTSTLQNPSHVYSAPGNYTVNLTVTDNDGAVNWFAIAIQVYINIPPTASFTYAPTSPFVGDLIYFTDTSTDADGSVDVWSWDFGDGSTSTDQNPSHTYSNPGNYTVTLTVTDNNGASNSVSMVILVLTQNIAPSASFTYSPANPETGQTITFTDTSTEPDAGDSIVRWKWDLGDGTVIYYDSSNYTSIIWHSYTSANNYTVKLTVWDSNGAQATAQQTINVVEPGSNLPPPPPEEQIPGFDLAWLLLFSALGCATIVLLKIRRSKRQLDLIV
ncbi:MAG: PKD domain-containing protein [Promethearchaeota archaeon]